MKIKRYETAKKTIMALIRTVDSAAKKSGSLDEKLEFLRLLKDIQMIDLKLSKHYYLIEDAINLEIKFKE